ncbi:MAG TPA: TetR/AcrR family transcriptional regulator [Thermotogota bacterium]|nr:TetR/AcrR family transcriptional regulator [Thermotogota bacterium]HPJ88728.1 TetR/AcrR family transcriptional regulator [Thermotogota bacterium]HPR97190.1 TetR/AcrR family transcriptional regulator [Thermotogota bacterium]
MDKLNYFTERIKETETTKEKLFLSAIYLFSTKGYENVGMRELSNFIGIKASSFYNHYPSKEAVFKSIFERFELEMNRVVFTEEEIETIVEKGDVAAFFVENMKRFSSVTGNPLFFTMLQIVFMESYKDRKAYEIAIHNLYYIRRGYTEAVLNGMIENGSIKPVDVELITAEYYYTLKGLLDEDLLQEVWEKEVDYIHERIKRHMSFFINLLTVG